MSLKYIILGCGYLGYNITNILQQNANEVRTLGLSSYYSEYLSDAFIEIDVFDFKRMNEYDFSETIVIDSLSFIQLNKKYEDEELVLRGIIKRYQELLQFLQSKNIKRYVFLSSGGTVYGNVHKPAKEEDELHPVNFYARSKVELEKLVKESSLPYLLLRVSNPYGGLKDRSARQGVIEEMIYCALEGQTFHLWGSLENQRDFIHIEDFTKAIELLCSNADSINSIFNLGSGEGYSIQLIKQLVEEASGKEILMEHEELLQAEISVIILDITKLQKYTSFKPEVSMKDGIYREVHRKGH